MSDDRTDEFFSVARSLPGSDGPGNRPTLHTQTTSVHSNRTPGGGRAERKRCDRGGGRASGGGGGGGTASAPTSGRYGARPPPPGGPTSAATGELRDFHATAAGISRDIAATSSLLSELTTLVRRRGLFVDDTERVNWLVLRIKSNIEGLNGRLDEAGRVIDAGRRRLGRNSQRSQEATNLVDQLKEEFVRATSGFKAALQARSDRMRENDDRRKDVFGGGGGGGGREGPGGGLAGGAGLTLGNKPPVYGERGGGGLGGARAATTAAATPPPPLLSTGPKLDLTGGGCGDDRDRIPAGESTSSQLPRPSGVRGEGGGSNFATPNNANNLRLRHSNSEPMPSFSGSTSTYHASTDRGTGGPPLTPLDIQRMESESGQEQTVQLIPDQNYLRERADAMTAVESNIVELGTIFNKLAVMVSEHREMVQRVEDNVDDANANVNLSLDALTDTLENLRSNRALFAKVFAVIVVFIVLFVTFFA